VPYAGAVAPRGISDGVLIQADALSYPEKTVFSAAHGSRGPTGRASQVKAKISKGPLLIDSDRSCSMFLYSCKMRLLTGRCVLNS